MLELVAGFLYHPKGELASVVSWHGIVYDIRVDIIEYGLTYKTVAYHS